MLIFLTVCVCLCTLTYTEIHIATAVLVKKAQITKRPPPEKKT